MKLNRLASVAIATAATAGLAIGLLSPANAAPKTTVQIVQSNALTGLNPSVSSQNLTFNTDVDYLEQIGFTYYNNKATLVDNTAFGTYKVVSQKPYKVQYTVNNGRLWSDGTTINGIDLLLSHVTAAGTYSQIAGLGDPADSEVSPAFDSLGYGGLYEQFVVGLPILSANKMSVTIEYSAKVPDWRLLAPGPSPVHALMLMAEGKKKLGTVAENNAARERFYKAFQNYNTASLKKMGAIWSKDYNVNQVNASTNPLLLVGNGPFRIQSAVANGAVTMVRNPSYNSGPKVKALQRVVFKVIGDGTAAAQALKNGEVDIYAGQPTADAVAQLKAMAPAVKVIGGDQAVYEHLDLRVGTAYGTAEPAYNGPFAGNSQKAKDLRTAFLLAYPREEIMAKIIKPINPAAQLMNSLMVFNSEPSYKDIIAKSGVSKFTAGTQASRTAAALALVKKHFPDAAAGSGSVKIALLYGTPTNSRRVSQAALAKAEWAKAGFDVDATPNAAWSRNLQSSSFDASFFAWVKSAAFQSGNVGTYETKANYQGYSNATVDRIYKELGASPKTPAQIAAAFTAVDAELIKDAVTLPVFQHPAANGVNAKLQGVAPSPFSPNLVWNLWDWSFRN